MRKVSKKIIVLIIFAVLIVFCILFVLYKNNKKAIISEIDRGANNCSVDEIKMNEWLGDTTTGPEEFHYIADAIETYDEKSGMYEWTYIYKDAINTLVYSGGNFLNIPAEEIVYVFDEENQKCYVLVYYINSEKREEVIDAIKKEVDGDFEKDWMEVDKEKYVFKWDATGKEIMIEIKFK